MSSEALWMEIALLATLVTVLPETASGMPTGELTKMPSPWAFSTVELVIEVVAELACTGLEA